MKLTIPYPPSVNRYWLTARGGRRFLSKQARLFKEQVKQLVGNQQILTGPVSLSIDVFRPRKRGDLDNVMKAILDSFNGLLYKDDGQVVIIIARRHDDKLNPRVEVEINAV